tara:strand:- start:677 stop:2017 length:1341 start_codon:yes stop_codon:yes gene_type:complete
MILGFGGINNKNILIMNNLDPIVLIIIFSSTIIISYLFNIYSKKTGIPSVLLLIFTGVLIGLGFMISGQAKPMGMIGKILPAIGMVGLALIVLEAALDLKIVKEKLGLIFKSLATAILGLFVTSYACAFFLTTIYDMTMVEALLFAVPLSILSSAIILPSLGSLSEYKKEFMIYESTFSDILGIVVFNGLIVLHSAGPGDAVYADIFGNLFFTIIFSLVASYILIYLFQNIKGHDKLFLLLSILLLLFAVGKMLKFSSLIIILIFGMMINNYRLFFAGKLSKLIEEEKVKGILSDLTVLTGESAFAVRTFFFIIFGLSVSIGSIFNPTTIGIGAALLLIIYIIRTICLFMFNGKNIFPQIFLAPRGLITILLFFGIPKALTDEEKGGYDLNGVLLFVILVSCLIMTWSLIRHKKNLEEAENYDEVIGEHSEIDVLSEDTIEEIEGE